MRLLKYLVKRIAVFIPLLFCVVFITFCLIRQLPGNPAETLAGPQAYEETIKSLEKQMGLDKPILEQFADYMSGLLKGDMGYSWFTSNDVTDDLASRFPATLELITVSIVFAIIIGVSFAVCKAYKPKGIVSRVGTVYGMLAGAFADFWLGLMLVFILFTKLRVVPSPMGRLNLFTTPPTHITGMYLVDSLLTGNMKTFVDAFKHLFLPALTLGLVHGAAFMKMTSSTMGEIIESDYIHHAKMMGLPKRKIVGHTFRNTIPAVLMTIGSTYSFLLGGAVLIENVFSWGGLGQYVTSALANKDYAALQGFIIVATLFSMILYLIIDLIQMTVDPRIDY